MSLKQSLYDYLSNNAGVSALVGSRIYPAGQLPSNPTYPLVTYLRVSHVPEHCQAGTSALSLDRFQFDAWADDGKEADDVADAVEAALDMYSGNMGSAGATTDVRICSLESTSDSVEAPTGGEPHGNYRVSQDYMIWHVT